MKNNKKNENSENKIKVKKNLQNYFKVLHCEKSLSKQMKHKKY